MDQPSQEAKASRSSPWTGHSLSSLTQRGAKEGAKERTKEEEKEAKEGRSRALGPVGSTLNNALGAVGRAVNGSLHPHDVRGRPGTRLTRS